MKTRAQWFILDRLHSAEQYGDQALAFQVSRENPKHLNAMIDEGLITEFFAITNAGSEFLDGDAPDGDNKIRIRWEKVDRPGPAFMKNLIKVWETDAKDLFYSPDTDTFFVADQSKAVTEWYISGQMDWESIK